MRFFTYFTYIKSWDSSVCILQLINKEPEYHSRYNGYATGLTEISGSIPGRGNRFFSSPGPDRLWVPPSLLYTGHRGLLPAGGERSKAAGA
jgi:hypothetical protein